MKVKGFNIILNASVQDYDIYLESILTAEVVDGTYCPLNKKLIRAIENNPGEFDFLFSEKANMAVLDYLEECNRFDNTPCAVRRLLVQFVDNDTLMKNDRYPLSDNQFKSVAQTFQNEVDHEQAKYFPTHLGFNILGITTTKGLFILAYRRVLLDVEHRSLVPDADVIINYEFTMDGVVYSIYKYLPEEDRGLLENFMENQERILHSIASNMTNPENITTSPFFVELQRQRPVDLHAEFKGIFDMYAENRVTVPVKAFFGELKNSSRRIKNYPITLINNRVNLDQLLAIHKAMKYPITYVQGPPGTGKTNTIINVLISAFFNEKTVLVSSYNNHPMNGVIEKLRELKFGDYPIPFPALRLGNFQYVGKALDEIKDFFVKTKKLSVFEDFLVRNRQTKETNVKALSDLLELYEERIDLLERKETIEQLIHDGMPMKYSVDIQSGQLNEINQRLEEIGVISNEQAFALLEDDYENFIKFVNYTSIKHIQRLKEPKYEGLMKILDLDDLQEKVRKFNEYLSDTENLKNFLRVFPIIITTNLSA
ncbi:MAG TPA: AAA domain-containing protein, partial [Candidatus Izemoplasmatales bacterium]|nr:AAA domain-containing protein [Candidatus Izemoplasmatales bacterium]